MRYLVEAQDLKHFYNANGSGKNFTLSFYVKAYQTGTYQVSIYKDDNGTRFITKTYTISSSGVWQRVVLNFTGDTGAYPVNADNGQGFQISFMFAAGTNYTSGSQSTTWGSWPGNAGFAAGHAVNVASSANNYVRITGIQLELGDIATPFEHRSFAEELNLCKRYFQSSFPSDVAPQNGYYATNTGASAGYAGATCFSTNNARSPQIYYGTEMRAQPTVTLYASSNNDTAGKWGIYSAGSGWTTPSTHTVDYFSNRGFGVRYSSASFGTVGESYLYRGMWTADAEL